MVQTCDWTLAGVVLHEPDLTCGDPIIVSPQALQPLAPQIGHAGAANQIAMVIERESGGKKRLLVIAPATQKSHHLRAHVGLLCGVLQGRSCRDGGVHLLSTTGPTGHSGTSRVIPVIYPFQRTEELKCICSINNSNRLIFLYWGGRRGGGWRVQPCFRERMGVVSAAGLYCPRGSD